MLWWVVLLVWNLISGIINTLDVLKMMDTGDFIGLGGLLAASFIVGVFFGKQTQ